MTGPLAVLLLLCALPASAHGDPHGDIRRALSESAFAFGIEAGAAVPLLVSVSTPPAAELTPADRQINFEYAEMVDRMEKLSRTVIGRNKKKRRIDTGVTPADRVEAGKIKYVVLHASGGATGKPGACEGTVSWLLSQRTAAHFMVCRDGRVIRMVKIENIANHVKNPVIDEASVGIETESGQPGGNPFISADWEPGAYWRMYASMAWLIRAIAKETDLPRDRAHVLTHAEADAGMARAHVDPGPFFESGSYPEFDARFPGQAVTPREFLMRLIGDDAGPQLLMVAASGAVDEVEVKDTNTLGLAHIRVWRQDAAGKVADLMHEWSAPVTGMPPVSVRVPVPLEPGVYRFVARDLVGNTSAAHVKVPEPGLGDQPPAEPVRFALMSGPMAALE
ncbi:MAG: peptidoglycan recognition family protein [Elusimicrobiota bacterium]|nr:peptidoglycan recognition family protein [Elusimicrobiota bacterium]